MALLAPGRVATQRRSFATLVCLLLGAAAAGCSKGQQIAESVAAPEPVTCPRSVGHTSGNMFPTWSPDGRTIAVIHGSPISAVPKGIYTISGFDQPPRMLMPISSELVGELSWSPDGSRIAMNRNYDIWTVDVASGAMRQWTHRTPYAQVPTWSPDGRYVLFILGGRYAGEADSMVGVHLIDTRDGSMRAIRNGDGPLYGGTYPARFSPDGRQIALSVWLPGGGIIRELFLIGQDGSHYRQLTHLGGTALNPQWSPDGERLYFDWTPAPCNPLGAANRKTWVVNADGSDAHEWYVTLGDSRVQAGFPFSLSPNGHDAAWIGLDSTGRFGVLWTSTMRGTKKRQITQPLF